jgi:hypothetical protein
MLHYLLREVYGEHNKITLKKGYMSFQSNQLGTLSMYDGNLRSGSIVRRQRDDDSQNKFLQINYCEEELLCIIHCMHVYMN